VFFGSLFRAELSVCSMKRALLRAAADIDDLGGPIVVYTQQDKLSHHGALEIVISSSTPISRILWSRLFIHAETLDEECDYKEAKKVKERSESKAP